MSWVPPDVVSHHGDLPLALAAPRRCLEGVRGVVVPDLVAEPLPTKVHARLHRSLFQLVIGLDGEQGKGPEPSPSW